jgi:hypothetical protein
MKNLYHLLVGISVLSLVGCATAGAEALPRIGHGLEAVKEAYQALCSPPPAGKEKFCENARVELNKAIDVYTKINDSVGSDDAGVE